jgi:signal transduction histidine kinase
VLPAPTIHSANPRVLLNARIFPALVFLACALITAFSIIQMRAIEENEAFANFSQISRRLARDVELRLAGLAQLASSGAGLLNTGEFLGREGWTSYIAGLQTIGHGTGFQGMGVALRVPVESGERFVARLRKEDVPTFHIWNRPGTLPSADGLFPVTYLVPVSTVNEQMVGFDLGSDPVFASAIVLARDRGEPSFSGLAKSGVDGDAADHGLFLFAPFYRGGRPDSIHARREAFAGVVLVALNAQRLLQPLVEQDGTRGIALRVTDQEQGAVVFDTRPGLDYFGSRFAVGYKATMGGRNWQIDFAGGPELVEAISHRDSLLIGLVGGFGALLLTGIVYHLAALRQRAEQRASEMTRELRASEAELLHHRDHLTDLVAERTADLLAAKDAAEQAYRAKSEFLANMSHELRTPLHAILSFARLGQGRTPEQADEKTQRYFSRIVDAGERLLSLVSDLLDLSRIETGKMMIEPQPGDLVKMLHDVAAEFEALAEERKLQWSLPSAAEQAPARVDAVRFSQVLRNVLSNAIKFSPDGGVIRILIEEATMTPVRCADDQAAPVAAWRIAVFDEGIGIPEDELETVFDSFVQSSKTRTGAGGTGLGLTICRAVVAAHRGSISARNRPEGGAVFEIVVPR